MTEDTIKLQADEEGYVLCPKCGERLQGAGIEYFGKADIVVDPDMSGGWSYDVTTNASYRGSELESMYCPTCSWIVLLFEGMVKVEVVSGNG